MKKITVIRKNGVIADVVVSGTEEQGKNLFLDHPLFKNYFVREARVFAPETECWRFSVPNHDDMEVSVIRSSMTYGGAEGLFELAMLRNDRCIYDTPITNDVVGWLDEQDVLDILEDVQRIYGEEA
nr:MAG TPA: Paratox [Bacteriophage sp.]